MKDFGKLNFSVAFQPTSAFPIDGRTVFSSYASALAAAKTAEEVGSTNTRYHIGMKLLVAEEGVEPVWYTITKDKTLVAEGDGSVADHNASAEAHKALFDAINKKIDDKEVDIPDKLPNPNAITFTGAASGTYDGSAPLTVNIPEGGGSSITVDDAFNPNSTNPVQNKVICAFVLEANETVLQIQNSIPTDAHINELINTALGDIETILDEINGEDV